MADTTRCADCNRPQSDPIHLETPGKHWGAALHWFRPATPAPVEQPSPMCPEEWQPIPCYVTQNVAFNAGVYPFKVVTNRGETVALAVSQERAER